MNLGHYEEDKIQVMMPGGRKKIEWPSADSSL